MQKLTIQTRERCQFLDITSQIWEAVAASGVKDGVATVFIPHTTAGVTVNENADPDVQHDLLAKLARLVPHHEEFYRHAEGNSDAHLKAGLLGCSVQLIISGGRLRLGTWQAVYFAEFDGPREREVWLQVC